MKNVFFSALAFSLLMGLSSDAFAAKRRRSAPAFKKIKVNNKARDAFKKRIDTAQTGERAALLEDVGLYHAALYERLQLAKSGGAPAGNQERLGNLALILDRVDPLRGISKATGLSQSLRAAVAAAHMRAGSLAGARAAMPDNVNGISDAVARVKAATIVAAVLAASGQSERARDILGSVPEVRDPAMGGLLQVQKARLAYSDGKLLEATESLVKISRQSPAWHSGVLISAWSAYRAKDYNLALGQLMTLTSPYLVGKFNPEAFVLQSAALYRLCYFEGSLESLRKLRALYNGMPQSIDRFTRTYGNRYQLVSAIINYARGTSNADEGSYPAGHYEYIMDGLLSSDPIAEVDRSLSQVKREQDNMGELLASARMNSRLQGVYRRELEEARKEYYRKGLKAATKRLSAMRREAADALENALAIEVEVNTRIRDRLITGKSSQMRDVDFDAEVKKGYEFWPFQGEYWQDEVGGYAFATSDVCGGQGT